MIRLRQNTLKKPNLGFFFLTLFAIILSLMVSASGVKAQDLPIADAGDDVTIAEGTTLFLNGGRSFDLEVQGESYAWTQVENGAPRVSLRRPTSAQPFFTAPNLLRRTRLVFELIVTDASGLVSAPDRVTITVTADNDVPVANAGDDVTVVEGASVTLNGTRSFDPEGEDLSYAWRQTGGTSVTLSDANTATPSFTPNFAITTRLDFALIVTDASGLASAASTVTITVTADNDVPVANAGDDVTVAEGASVTLNGTRSFDPEGEDLHYAWRQTGGTSVALSDANTATPSFTPNFAITTRLEFTLIVTVGHDPASAPDRVTITVTADNDAPVANAGDDVTVVEGASVTLNGTRSFDPEGEDLSYAWTQVENGAPRVSLRRQNARQSFFTAPNDLVTDATLVFELIVTDASGLVSAPNRVTITVTADNDVPVANAGDDVIVAEGASVTLNGTRSFDPEGEDLSYAWTQVENGAPRVSLRRQNARQSFFTAPSDLVNDARLGFTLIVTDVRGLVSVPDRVTITVTITADVTLPVISLLGDAAVSIELGTAYTDAGATALDNIDGDITSDIVTAGTVDTDTAGSYTISYNVMDAAGNAAAEITRTVTITADVTLPVISLLGDAAVSIELGTAYTDAGATALDNIDGDITSDIVTAGTVDTDTAGSYTISYNVMDAAGNAAAEITRTVTITADAPKVLTEAEAVMLNKATHFGITPDMTVQKTVETINRFLETRTKLILANQPNRDRRINRLQRGVGSEQLSFATGEITKLKPFEFNFLSLGSGNYKFATSLDQVTRAADHLQVMQGDVGGLTTTHERRRFDVWFEGQFNKFEGSAGSGGEFGVAYLGADYLVSPDLLFGALVQYDQLSDSSTSGDYTIKGKGWMAGPYVTARLRENLYFDARLAWGRSDNDISLNDNTNSFKSERWLTDVSLSGEFKQGNWTIRPNVSLSYMEDRQQAYQNTLGVTVPGQTVSQGQLRFGPNFSTSFLGDNGWRYEPAFTLDAIYSHTGTRGATLSNTTGAQDGWRARFETGLGMTTPKGTRLTLTGNYDGIGQSGFEAWGFGLNVDMKF